MDQLREDTRERTWEDYVETASAALAMGAGAALFLRNGGARKITRAATYLSEYRDSLSQQFLDNPIHSFESLERTVRDNFAAATTKANQSYIKRLSKLDNPLSGGVIGDIWSSIRRSVDDVTEDSIKNDVLTAKRKVIAQNTLNRIQEFALKNSPENALDEAEMYALGRFADMAAISNTTMPEADMMSFIAKQTDSESAYQRALNYASAIREELKNNEQVLMPEKGIEPRPWNFVEREVSGFDKNGVHFGKPVKEYTVMQDAIELSKKGLDTDWQSIVEQQNENKDFFSDLVDSVMGRRVTMGELISEADRGNQEALAFFESDKSWPAALKNIQEKTAQSELVNPLQEIRDAYQKMGAQEKALFGQIKLDTIRIQEGHMYSTKAINDVRRQLMADIGNTLPGRIFRLNDVLLEERTPVTKFFAAGTLDRELAAVLGSRTAYTNRDVLFHRGRSYGINADGTFEEIKGLRNFTLRSSRIGSQAEIYKAMHGLSDGRDIKDRNIDGVSITAKRVLEEFGNNLDFFVNDMVNDPIGRNRLAQSVLIHNEDYHGIRAMNRIDRFMKTMERYVSADAMDTKAYRGFRDWYSRNATEQDSTVKEILDTLVNISGPKGEEKLYEYLGQAGTLSTPQRFMNEKLKRLFSNFQKDPAKTMGQGMVHADQTKLKDASAYVIENFHQNIQKELTKELFMQMDAKSSLGAEAIQKMIDANLSGERRKNIRSLAGYSIFELDIGYKLPGKDKKSVALSFMDNIGEASVGRYNGRTKLIFDSFVHVRDRFNFEGEAKRIAPSKEIFAQTEDFHFVHKKFTFNDQIKKVQSMLKNANAYTFDKASGTWKSTPEKAGTLYIKDLKNIALELIKPITQYVSGNDVFGAYSTSSHKMFHVMNRVNDQLKYSGRWFGRDISVDFRLRQQNAGSAAAIMTNLVTRRVLPLALGMTALDWADDATRYFTGAGIGEAAASGLANSYLGIKRLTGAIGLDSSLKSLTSDNPIVKYWGGTFSGSENPEWNTYEEQKKYYEKGYTAIRRNRGWWFGSSNEIRGNRIAYFEPNTLRMLRSNYYMKSMYDGSMWKKWSHSLMPTPTNPLSPLFYLADPYYLEEMHKEDRPYPVTGSTFAENTPWGIALNPIFDTFIKPRKQMYRNRLGSDGIDVRALIAHVNEDIKRRSMSGQGDDIIYLQNGKLRSMLFTAFNAPTPSQRIVSSKGNEITFATDYGSYGSGVAGTEISTALENGEFADSVPIGYGSVGELPVEDRRLVTGQPVNTDQLTISDRLVLSAGKGNPFASTLVSAMKQNGIFDSIRGANVNIKQRGALRKDQGFFYENKKWYEQSTVDDMLSNSETISDLMTQGKGADYIHEMEVATRNITGLYGYLASLTLGIGENNQKRIATSQNMESFSRRFWDMSIGGVDMPGSDVMEIARRFVPNYQRQAMVNPLMNTMPDWLPERMRFGDPYASIPKGEARLPGKGYESLNQLHPDIYGNYGAFDRFKILADVAPYSPEYKFWKKVVGATIKDPKLKEEIQEIKDRVAQQTSGHDFYNYKYIGRGIEERKATITEVLNNGKFKVDGSDQIYKLSGVSIKAGKNGESTQDVLGKYIYAGQEVVLATDANPYYARNNDRDNTINAGVLVDGQNVSEMMLASGEARKRKGDTSTPSYMLKHGTLVNLINTASEAIGHMDTPVWHSRVLRIDSPLESYKDDYVYGTSYQSWSEIARSFVLPNFKKFASSPSWMAIGIGAEILNNNIQDAGKTSQMLRSLAEGFLGHEINISTKKKWLSTLATYTLNRGQLTGELIGTGLFMGASKNLAITNKFKDLGSMAALGYAAFANPNNLAVSTMAWSRLGWKAAELIEEGAQGKAALAGAAIGIARWAFSQKTLASADNANTYVPDEARKRWDMQEYFDRLTYIKYMGLYEQAADKAMEEEGINVRKIINAQEEDRKKRFNLKQELKEQLLGMKGNDPETEAARKLIYRKLAEASPKIGIRGGEWTKSAIMYKNAADATMYGLDENAVMADIVRALPKTERDYFIEFMKEKDPEKREEILQTVSPLLNRALRTIWKMPLPKKVSNEEYFVHHTLPAPLWSGWRPDVDLANVEAKVIYNQGMMYSDMGVYASEYRKPEVQNAPNIEYDTDQNSSMLTRLKLQMAITGTGVDADSVSVEPSPDSTIQVIANVARIIPYKINYEVDNILRKI